MAVYEVVRPIERSGVLYWPHPRPGETVPRVAKSASNGWEIVVNADGVISLSSDDAARFTLGQLGTAIRQGSAGGQEASHPPAAPAPAAGPSQASAVAGKAPPREPPVQRNSAKLTAAGSAGKLAPARQPVPERGNGLQAEKTTASGSAKVPTGSEAEPSPHKPASIQPAAPGWPAGTRKPVKAQRQAERAGAPPIPLTERRPEPPAAKPADPARRVETAKPIEVPPPAAEPAAATPGAAKPADPVRRVGTAKPIEVPPPAAEPRTLKSERVQPAAGKTKKG